MKKKTIKKKKINSDKLPDVAVLMANAFLAGLITKYYCEQLMLLKKRSKKWHKG